MNTRPWRLQAVVALLTLAALALAAVALTSRPGVAAPVETGPITGQYTGSVQLRHVLVGVLSAPLSTPTPAPSPTPATQLDMPVDLSLTLQQTGSQVTGFVMLDRTILYPRVTTISATPVGPTPGPGTPTPRATPLGIGPRVTGTFDGTTLTLTSEQYELLIAPARRLANGYTIPEQKVTRQFSLVGTVRNGGNTVTGEYRETVWGYGKQPSTAIGSFTLNRPVFVNVTPLPTSTPGPAVTTTSSPTVVPASTSTPTSVASPTNTPVAVVSPTSTATSMVPPTTTPTTAPSSTSTPATVAPPTTTPTAGVSPTTTPTAVTSPTATRTSTPSPTATPTSYRTYLPLISRASDGR